MIKVRRDLCLACGRCAITCFRRAISLDSGQAEIDQSRCNGCGICIEACAQEAIIFVAAEPITVHELSDTVASMRIKTDDIIRRIGELKRS